MAMLSLLVIASVGTIPELAEWEESGPVVLWGLAPLLLCGLLLWGLRRNPPSKYYLALIVAVGSLTFTLLGLAILLIKTGPMARSVSESGEAASLLNPAALAFAGAACAALAIRIYYLLKRAPGDFRILFRAFALIVVFGLVYAVAAGGSIREKQRALKQNAVSALHLINTAEAEYAKTYKLGYSPTLDELRPPPPGTPPSATSAGSALPALEGGIRLGYRFTYVSGKPDSTGFTASYSLSARPLRYRRGTRRNFYTDQTGVIRFTKEDREATAQDPPLP
jgi:hypothetical protein